MPKSKYRIQILILLIILSCWFCWRFAAKDPKPPMQVESTATTQPTETATPSPTASPTNELIPIPTETPMAIPTKTQTPSPTPKPAETPILALVTETQTQEIEPTEVPTMTARQRAIEENKELFQEIAANYGLDWEIMANQAYWESRFDSGAIGKDGELGLMQIHPATWDSICGEGCGLDPFKTGDNLTIAAKLLVQIKGNCERWGDYIERLFKEMSKNDNK
jgi:hypothetical protein